MFLTGADGAVILQNPTPSQLESCWRGLAGTASPYLYLGDNAEYSIQTAANGPNDYFVQLIVKGALTGQSDVDFAKDAFSALALGENRVEGMIDWDTYRDPGSNVAQAHAAKPNDTEKATFRRKYIFAFSSGFREVGEKLENFSNWRQVSSDATQATVAFTGSAGDPLTVTISKRNGERKMSSFQSGG